MKPNILLLVIDSFRADKCFGNTKTSITPNIDSLIKKGIYFSQAISSSPASIPAVSSIITGLYPFSSLTLQKNVYNLNPEITTFIQQLTKIGYNVHATIPQILEFMSLKHVFGDNIEFYDNELTLYDGLGQKIIEKFESNILKDPWFYYLHLNDLHGHAIFHKDVLPKQFFDKKYGVNQYERMASLMDVWIGRILQNINIKNTLIILTADHGSDVGNFTSEMEEMNEFFKKLKTIKKGKIFGISHKLAIKSPKMFLPIRKKLSKKYVDRRNKIVDDRIKPELESIENSDLRPYQKRIFRNMIQGWATVYDEKFRIPLIFCGRGIDVPKIQTQQVRSVDIFPTVFDILDFVKTDQFIHGQSLVPLIKDENVDELYAYVESATNVTEGLSTNTIGIRSSKYKYFRNKDDPQKNIHLFDLVNDPFEEHNIVNDFPKIVKLMEAKLLEIKKTI